MNKHVVIMKNEKGELGEGFIITKDSARTLKSKNIPGLVAITETKRVNHPSPAVMVAALENLGVDLTNFYTVCETIKAEQTEPETTEDENAE